MHCAGRCTVILHFGTPLGHWTDHAARTGKRSMPVGSACEPSAHEFPLTLVMRDRGREPRIPFCVGHADGDRNRTGLLVIRLKDERQPGPLCHALSAAKVRCFICTIFGRLVL